MFKWIFLAFAVLAISIFLQEGDKIDHITKLPHELTGNKNSETLVIFLHGYPNTLRVWDTTISQLQNYLCLNISYPNFHQSLKLKWGLKHEDLVRLIRSTIFHISNENPNIKKKILVTHDWGAIYGYFFDTYYPKEVDHMIALDIGTGVSKNLGTKLYFLAYQSYLASSYAIGGFIGNKMTDLWKLYLGDKVWGNTPEDMQRWDVSWNFPYFYMIRHLLTYKDIIANYKPSVSLDFIYGADKPHQFHNEDFTKMIEQLPNSSVKGVNSGHWIMKNNSGEIVEKVKQFIERQK
jgi:pimeloyl-ACP methyl ester carboxylesterase